MHAMGCLCLGLFSFLAVPGEPLRFLDTYRERAAATGPLYSRGWTEKSVRWAEAFLPQAKARVEARLGRQMEGRFTTVLVSDFRELRDVVRRLGGDVENPHTRGVTLPSHRLIVVRGDVLFDAAGGDPRAVTLTHEVAHLVLHRRPGLRLPRWLDEGVAVWVSQEQLTFRDEAELSLLARAGGLYSFEGLEERFPESHNLTTIAYRQSHLMVVFLKEQYGAEAIVELLDRLEGDAPVQQALEVITGLSLEELEEDFVRWTASRHSLLVSLVALVNIWTLCALLALVAIARYIFKKRRGMRRLEDEDRREDDAGAEPD